MMEEKAGENPKIPRLVCLILTIFTLTTILAGFFWHNPFIIILGILPAALYEAIRTEGYSTRAGSIAIFILVILEIFAIKGIIKINLAQMLGREQIYLASNWLPLGDIVFVFPTIAAIISFMLLVRTYGIYTKWLSVLLLASSICLLYMVNKNILMDLIGNQVYY